MENLFMLILRVKFSSLIVTRDKMHFTFPLKLVKEILNVNEVICKTESH